MGSCHLGIDPHRVSNGYVRWASLPMIPIRVECPGCGRKTKYTIKSSALDQREAAVARREAELAQREQRLQVREAEHKHDVRLIKSCLHPDKHPEQAERYTRAWQAFERLLAPGAKPAYSDDFDDDIPF